MSKSSKLLPIVTLFAGASLARAQVAAPPVLAPPAGEPSQMTAPAQPLDFHASLAPFGTWTTLAPFGEVWVPRDLPTGWRPYTRGHWVFADGAGWTWVADEPWGWACFHYGRWTLDASLGWVWIPGDVWAPAWVAWRQNPGFVGWAPLPPAVGWSLGVGLTFGNVDLALGVWDPWWSFVPVGHFCHPHVCDVLLVPERTVVLVHNSRLVQRCIFVEHGRPVNRPFTADVIEKATGVPVKHVVLRDVERPEEVKSGNPGPDEVAVFRPDTPRPRADVLAVVPSEPRSAERPAQEVRAAQRVVPHVHRHPRHPPVQQPKQEPEHRGMWRG